MVRGGRGACGLLASRGAFNFGSESLLLFDFPDFAIDERLELSRELLLHFAKVGLVLSRDLGIMPVIHFLESLNFDIK